VLDTDVVSASSSFPSVVLFVGVGVRFGGVGMRTFCPHFGQVAFVPARSSVHCINWEQVGQLNRMGYLAVVDYPAISRGHSRSFAKRFAKLQRNREISRISVH
jgi:hypothetical protein